MSPGSRGDVLESEWTEAPAFLNMTLSSDWVAINEQSVFTEIMVGFKIKYRKYVELFLIRKMWKESGVENDGQGY